MFSNDHTGATGTWSFYNNLVYSLNNYENGNFFAAALVVQDVDTNPSQIVTCDYNAYGSGMSFSPGWANSNQSLATWQGYGFDTHSTTLSATPFTGTPAEAQPNTVSRVARSMVVARSAVTSRGNDGV
jgi:hypothetical protein